MTTYIPEALRHEVNERAQSRCEYCLVHQDDRLFAHEIDHIYAGETRRPDYVRQSLSGLQRM